MSTRSRTSDVKASAPRRSRRRWPLALVVTVMLVGALAMVPANAQSDTGPVEVVAKIRWGSRPSEVAADLDATVLRTLIGSRRVVLLGTEDKDAKSAAKRLERDPRIIWVEENVVGTTPEGDRFHAWPSETFPRVADAAAFLDQPVIDALGLDEAHGVATGAGVRVAVLDTGVDADHPTLEGRVKRRLDVIDGDFAPDDVGNGIDDDKDGHVDEAVGHGTHVAGAILLAAPDAQILAYRVLDSDGQGTVFGVAEAIRHAVDAGAHVVNLSFGAEKKFESNVLADALAYARDHDVLVVAAAGNAGSGQKRYPAADGSILSVGALDLGTGEMAKFASHGKWVSVAAPGVDITSTVPGGRFATWSGSSMAAPFVSAQAALLLSTDLQMEVKTLEKLIRDEAVKVHGPKVDKGRIDLAASLAKALK